MQQILRALNRPSLNWRLVFMPVSIVFEIAHKASHADWASPTVYAMLGVLFFHLPS